MTERITATEYLSLGKRRHKFGAKSAWRCLHCGGVFIEKIPCCNKPQPKRFPSRREARRYDVLRQKEELGVISRLGLQPKYEIVINGEKVCTVVLDFKYLEYGVTWVVEDSKGHDNAMSKLKRKLVKACHGVDVVLV